MEGASLLASASTEIVLVEDLVKGMCVQRGFGMQLLRLSGICVGTNNVSRLAILLSA